jgi:2-haloacid dehalogenase
VGQPPIKWKSAEKNIKGILFDAFAIFDPRPVLVLAEKIFPGKGSEIIETWRLKQFEYTWLREVAGQYRNFKDVTTDSLLFAARKAQVRLTEADKLTLINAYFSLDLWPDSLPTLEYLRKKTIRIGLLSNMTATMLGSCIQFNHLDKYFEAVLSTDQRKTYKPSPRAYQMGWIPFR